MPAPANMLAWLDMPCCACHFLAHATPVHLQHHLYTMQMDTLLEGSACGCHTRIQ